MLTLTREEKNAIATLRRLEKRWPKSLIVFVESGVMKIMKNHDPENDEFDSDDVVAHINIDSRSGQL